MKTYQTPETICLSVNAQTMLCASGDAPKRQGQLGVMNVTKGTWS